MTCKDIQNQIPDYLLDNLDAQSTSAVQSHLASCSSCQSEFESLAAVWEKLASVPDEAPDEQLTVRFYAMLDAYQAGQKHARQTSGWYKKWTAWLERWWPQQPAWQFGLASLLLLTGLLVGYFVRPGAQNHDQEVVQLRREVNTLSKLITVSLLQQQSSVDRLKGVNYSYQIANPDREVLSTLLNTLNYDPSPNVRLAALDALTRYYNHPDIRGNLMQSLNRQSSPLIQVALINLFVEAQDKQSVGVLKQIASKDDLDPTVLKHVKWAIQELH